MRLWVGRGALVWLAAPVVWIAARAYGGQASPTSFWLAGLAVGLVGAVVGAVVVPTRDMPGGRVSEGRLDHEEYVELVLSCVEQVPRGRVTTYGAIAEVVGPLVGGEVRGWSAR